MLRRALFARDSYFTHFFNLVIWKIFYMAGLISFAITQQYDRMPHRMTWLLWLVYATTATHFDRVALYLMIEFWLVFAIVRIQSLIKILC